MRSLSRTLRELRLETAALLLTLLSVGGLMALADWRGSWSAVAGDESTFLAMTESLVADGDLAFTDADRRRLDEAADRARKIVILQRSGDRIAYSKPVLYPLLGAPFLGLFGRSGLAIFNAVALLAAVAFFWSSVRRGRERGAWALTLATFVGTGAVLPQVAWSMGDALQLALALAGSALCLDRRATVRSWPGALLGGALLGLLTTMRLPNAIVALAVVAALAIGRRGRRAAFTFGGAVIAVVLMLGVTSLAIGSVDPYRAERATFNPATGYPAGPDAVQALDQFVEGRATQRLGVRPVVRTRVSAYAGLYFLVGRHTGLLVYFPIAAVLLAAALRRPERDRLILVLGAGGLAAFYLIWMPENYFGGASFVGNRYVLPALALLLAALPRPPRIGWLVGVWVLSAVCLYSAFVSVAGERGRPFSSQSHAYAGLFRALPYESTALAIEDREDRYFSDEFLRFVDGNAEVTGHGFHLRAGGPPAEILLATPRPSGILRFLVWVGAPEAELVFADWRGEQRFPLRPAAASSGGLVEIVAAPAWRRHPFWWTDGSWRAHSIRLAIEVPDGAGGTAAAGGRAPRAELRHLGPYRLAPKFFSYEGAPVELPATAETGSRSSLAVVLTNRGRRPWKSEADVPVHLVSRLSPVGDSAGSDGSTRFIEIVDPVGRGELLELTVEQPWPQQAGSYRLELDLVVGGVEPFQGWLGGPLAAGVVEVVAPAVTGGAVVSSR